ncbi:MAG: 50S ribosomal protein L18 [Chloroflexi bacterium]|nr:50S ribosomal protein L18 [Chloroflexota bacterium]
MGRSRFDMRPRLVRHRRVREQVSGTADRPRLSVFRSSQHIYAQVIDDEAGHTLATASTIEKDVKPLADKQKKAEAAAEAGTRLAQRAKAAGIKAVIFDRGGFKYHGRVKALAEAARKEGLEF